jgi:putative tryptophan/tyrosine transport system substrate-binding protein
VTTDGATQVRRKYDYDSGLESLAGAPSWVPSRAGPGMRACAFHVGRRAVGPIRPSAALDRRVCDSAIVGLSRSTAFALPPASAGASIAPAGGPRDGPARVRHWPGSSARYAAGRGGAAGWPQNRLSQRACGPIPPSPASQAFREGLRERGWIEGQNIEIEFRFAAGNAEHFLPFAKELVERRVDVILAASNRATSSAMAATTVTGLTWDAGLEIGGKRLELLKQISPGLTRVVNLWDPRDPGLARYWPSVQLTAKANRVVAVSAEVRSAEESQPALADARDQRAGIFIWGGPLLNTQSKAICDFALAHRLPTIFTAIDPVSKDGCLIGYAPSTADLFRRAATYVDRILRGAKPADLPVEQPTKFDLVINLKIAKALGLTIPPSLLARADQVIE